MSSPPVPPCIAPEIIETIKAAKASNCIIEDMSVKEWYRFLMEREFTFTDDQSSLNYPVPCKVELNSQYSDWNLIWTNCHLPSFTSKMTSFSFKLVHDLIPSEERISRIIPNNSSVCKHCSDNSIADTLHVFFLCSLSQELGDWLLRVVREVDATATPDSVLRLEIYGGDALVWLTVAALSYTWEQRAKKKKAITTDFISICQGDLDIIDLTKHQNIAMLAKNYLSL